MKSLSCYFMFFLKKCVHCKFKNLNNQGRLKLFGRDAIHCDQSLIQNEPFVGFSVNDENNMFEIISNQFCFH